MIFFLSIKSLHFKYSCRFIYLSFCILRVSITFFLTQRSVLLQMDTVDETIKAID